MESSGKCLSFLKIYIQITKTPSHKPFLFCFFSISQFNDTENDPKKKCKNYPNEEFKSYRECDEHFVYNYLKDKLNVTPFWATYDMKEVTAIKR